MKAGETIALSRKQAIQDFSTRKHHAGAHKVELLANGRIIGSGNFDLII